MTRFSHSTTLFLLFFSVLCIPVLSDALTVTISEVDPLWIPEASTKTNLSVAWATVIISDIDPNRDQYKVVQITLNNVTTVKGICCNSTDQDITDTDMADVYKNNKDKNGKYKDLIFRTDENPSWIVVSNQTLRYQIPSENTKTTIKLSVGVLSLDYGGYGELHGALYRVKRWTDASFDFKIGDKKYKLQTEFSDEDDVIQVPRDKNGNKIADSWQSDYYSPAYALTGDTSLLRDFGNKEDKDESTDKTYKGDHLTAYEEYRGFMVYSSNKPTSGSPKVKHTRTSPDTKNLFVVNEDSDTNLYGTGTAPSQISPQLLPSSRVRASGWINFNDPNGLVAFSVKVVSNSIADPGQNPTYGEVPLGPPQANNAATIYTGTIKYHEAAAHLGDVIRATIGHELAHAAHLAHCPKADVKDANGKDKGWDKKCLMWPAHVSSQNEYASHHDVDYALARPVNDPQTPVELDAQGRPLPKRGTLVPSNGSYTATAGDSHTANFTAPSAYRSVYWYVKTPSDTSAYGTSQEIDQGDGSTTTADFTYTFPGGVSGTYQIMAYVYGGDNIVYEEKYTVSVSVPSSSTTPASTTPSSSTTPAASTVSLPVWSNIPDPYNLTVGESFTLDLNSYVTGSPTITTGVGVIPAGLSLSAGVLSGTVSGVESRSIRFIATNAAGTAKSEWVDINITSTQGAAPVWSNIPDPYNLTVGESFTLNLSRYVTGSPTFTRNGGKIPTGLRFRNGVVSGTVSRVESRSFRFTATNSIGSADSEWIRINVTAAQ